MIAEARGLLPASLFAHLGEGPRQPGLPQRVLERIRAKEEEAERLIGWVQIALVTIFATLYAITPPPTDAAAGAFTPVPFVLAGYAVFTLARLRMAHRNMLPGWLLVGSIIADMALLLSLIWLFHVQYHQPAAFSLKVPTFIYIFVLIAVRALRFDHRFVLTAGLVAAAGWTLLTLAAVRSSGTDAITRNFVTYLTSNSVLIGAELDKVIAILMVTGLLTFAARRGQGLLVTAVREQAAGQEVKRFLSAGVAEAIAAADTLVEAGHAAARDAAIVMLDIRGFTRFSACQPAEQVVAMLTGFHARVVPIIRGRGGVIDKFLGDGVMATFGAVAPSPTAAADALAALGAVMAEARRWLDELEITGISLPLEVNGAAAAGRVVFATLGNGDRLEYTVIGDAVNLAAKLEKHNKIEASRALVPLATYELALAQGFRPEAIPECRQARTVAGVEHPIDLIVLAG